MCPRFVCTYDLDLFFVPPFSLFFNAQQWVYCLRFLCTYSSPSRALDSGCLKSLGS